MTNRLHQLYASLKDCWNGGLKEHFFRSAAAFLILSVIFFGLSTVSPQIRQAFLNMVESAMNGAIAEDGGIDGAFILSHNITACGLIMLYGFLPFVRLSALPLGINAMVMGCMAQWYLHNDISLLTYFAGILPHGLLEFPAMFLAFAVGLYTCDNISRYLRKDKSALSPWGCAVWLARFHILVLVPLLTGAALLEVYVTPRIMNLFL